MRRASYFAFSIFILVASFVFYKPALADVLIHVRYQDTVAFEGEIALPESTTTTLNDSAGNPHDISSNSALYLLSLASASTSSKFLISDLQYYNSFGAFYVSCIDIATTTPIHACGNWQYAVNGNTPLVGSDKYLATTSDDIYFYYGNQRQFSVSATSTDTATPIIVTAQKYNFTSNSWSPLSGTIVDATQPDPANPWSPFIIASSTTDADGTASLLLANAGQYNIGLRDDGYYPTIIVVASSTASTTNNQEENNTGGNTGGGQIQTPYFDTNKAVQFLISQQKSDDSFGAPLYTDWAAIGLASYPGQDEAKNKLRSYFIANTNPGSFVTDFERRAMALMALGINPYSGTSVDYIKKITDQFDGTQIGDSNLYNDDIFALFPLLKAGYSSGDQIIQKTTSFIISKQSSDGSWESVDLTAAAIQALSQVTSLPNTSSALAKAEQYLRSVQTSGGFGNSSAASWALQAVPSLGQSPLSFIANLQQTDGGVEPISAGVDNRVWATAYAIPATLGKSWPNILNSFPKPTQTQNLNQAVSSASSASITQNAATSTILVSTTTATNTPIMPAQVENIKKVPATYKSPQTQTVKNPEESSEQTSSTSLKSEPIKLEENQIAAVSTASGATKNKPWLLASGIIIAIIGLAYYFRSALLRNL